MKKIAFNGNKNIIHAQLRYYRELRNMSQSQVVAKLQTMGVNIDQQALSKIENNLRIVTDYELACFCKVLGITEKELLSDFYELHHD